MSARQSEGTASAIRILRMRGLVHIGSTIEPSPFRARSKPVWIRTAAAAEQAHGQQQLRRARAA